MRFLISILIMSLVGCAPAYKKTIPMQTSVINKDESTIVIYNISAILVPAEIILDRDMVQGLVTNKKPLRFSVKPGIHELNTDTGSAFMVDKIRRQEFKKDTVYFFRLQWNSYPFYDEIKLMPTQVVDSIESESYVKF